jgi:U3 small nucleolar RNA-associated protein 23
VVYYIKGEANKHRYVVATQSHPLRVGLRAIPGVPIVHVNRSVMILEPASDATLHAKQNARCAINFPTKQLTYLSSRLSGMRSRRPHQKGLF